MRSIRAVFCSNSPDLPAKLDELRENARAVRKEPGCLEFDYFRDVEFPENFVQLELWDGAQAFDRHWKTAGAGGLLCGIGELSAPHHAGKPEYPRRHGANGVEFYPHQRFRLRRPIFVPEDESDHVESIRWPSRGAVRIVIQSCVDPESDDAFKAYSAETRAQKGCLEFSYARSLEFPENNLHLELWAAPPHVYDEHFYLRTAQTLWKQGLPRPPSRLLERKYGADGFEFYQHGFHTLVGEVWEPEDPAQRLATIRWA
ncbi:MAG: hypothetical protein K0Q70_636 [Rhodospirillales bacterium]|nr:hypothetical protein [Rhodospirillales bacterium]MCE3257652.1 hypothetical protein [Nitrobacter vulgaris]